MRKTTSDAKRASKGHVTVFELGYASIAMGVAIPIYRAGRALGGRWYWIGIAVASIGFIAVFFGVAIAAQRGFDFAGSYEGSAPKTANAVRFSVFFLLVACFISTVPLADRFTNAMIGYLK